MDLVDALRLARAGRAVVFLGAGFSRGAPSASGGPMKSGQEFSDHLARLVGLPEGAGLMDTSEAYLEEHGALSLVDELQKEFTASELLPHHLAISSVPWKQIYTTNYDDIVEKSFAAARAKLQTVNPDTPIASIDNGVTSCIHLNGSIIGISAEKLTSQIKLTDSSYLTSSLADSEWAVRLRQDIDAAQAVFYVGYSTYDLDIARLLFSKPSLKSKGFFVVGTAASPVLKRRIEKFGVDTGLDSAEFFAEIVKDDYLPSTMPPVVEYCIRTYEPERSSKAHRDEDVFDLFLFGRLSSALVFESLTGDFRYALARRQVENILQLIGSSPSGVVVHSGLGNGKTLILEMLKVRAFTNGFTVIELLRQQPQLFEELELALKRPGRLLFIVDNYGNWLDTLKFIGNHRTADVSIVMAARSSTNDVLASRSSELLRGGDLHEFPADRLSDAELVTVVQAMDAYGLWGAMANWAMPRKLSHLSKYCKGEWQAILVELFKAPQIRDRLDKLIAGIKEEKTYNLVLIAILVLAVIDIPATTDVLTDLCGERTLTVGFRQNQTIRELIDFDKDEVKLRSSVTGAFLLRSVSDPQTVLESLITITNAADKAAYASREYMTLLGTLLRFGNIQNFFSDSDRSDLVIRYYEAVKELPHCKRSPLFWLQYAMACLFVDDFERAEKYFDSAYSFAKVANFRTYQIDNHYARFLLRRSINKDELTSAMEHFRKARALIFEQMHRERLHYPYRVASLIGEWYDAYSDRLSDEQRTEVRRAAVFVCSRIAALPALRQEQRDIADCYRKMQTIVQES